MYENCFIFLLHISMLFMRRTCMEKYIMGNVIIALRTVYVRLLFFLSYLEGVYFNASNTVVAYNSD